MTNMEWEAERLRLESAVEQAAENLLLFSGAGRVTWECIATHNLPFDTISISMEGK